MQQLTVIWRANWCCTSSMSLGTRKTKLFNYRLHPITVVMRTKKKRSHNNCIRDDDDGHIQVGRESAPCWVHNRVLSQLANESEKAWKIAHIKKWKFWFFDCSPIIIVEICALAKNKENSIREALITLLWPKFLIVEKKSWKNSLPPSCLLLSDRHRCASHNNSRGRMSRIVFQISFYISKHSLLLLWWSLCCEKFTLSRMSEYFS